MCMAMTHIDMSVNIGEHLSEGPVMMLSDVTVPSSPLTLTQFHDESHCQSVSASFSHHHHQQQQQQSTQCCLVLLSSVRAHQQSINVMRCHGDRVVTASNDHTLKVSSCCCCCCCTVYTSLLSLYLQCRAGLVLVKATLI